MATQALKPSKIILLFLLIALTSFGTLYAHFHYPAPNLAEPSTESEPTLPAEPALPEPVNFQPTVDAWLTTISGKAGVYIYDLDLEQVSADYQSTTVFRSESLYKLFVAYKGYQDLTAGLTSPTDPVSSGHNRAKCLDLSIRESHSPCAEALRHQIGIDHLNQVIKNEWGIPNTNIANLNSTAQDVTKVMQLLLTDPNFSAETHATIKDSLLNQPCTNNGLCSGCCNWRQGLPSGFSSDIKVYNKVGWLHSGTGNIWTYYHDTALVEFPARNSTTTPVENQPSALQNSEPTPLEPNKPRHFLITIMTSRVHFRDIARLATDLETFFYQNPWHFIPLMYNKRC